MATNNIEKQSFTYVSNTAATSGEYCAILAIEDATFTSLTWPELTGSFSGVLVPAGVTIYGQITSAFQLSSGAVLAYHAA
jgi:hypothetical protein